MAEISYDKLQDAFERALRNTGFSGSGSSTGSAPATSGSTSGGIKGAQKAFEDASKGAGDALKGFASAAEDNVNTFRDMSRSGSNFSNDLVGMTAAAAQSRVTLGEFSQVVKDNGKYLSGMGGSITRGTEAFAKLSDGFFKNNMDKDLRNLGYTSKELNEVLAMQASIQRTATTDDEKSRSDTRASAAAMAKEMDMMAKLTGKSRQEQMEIMQKNRVDGQVEAKLRLMTMGKTEEEARKIRTEAQNALKQAELEGRGQMAKELFATGTLISDEATSQFATFGKASQATADQMESIRKGEFDRAKQFGQQATAEMLKNQQNVTLLTQASLGEAGGPIAKTMMKNIETMGPFNDAVQSTAKSMGMLLNTQEDYAKALIAARQEIERSRMGFERGARPGERGQFVGGTVAGMTALERARQDVGAGVAGAAMARTPQGGGLASEASRAGLYALEGTQRAAGGPGRNIGGVIQEQAQRGLETEGREGGGIGKATSAAVTFAKGAVTITGETFLSVTGKIGSMMVGQGRSSGSLGATGKLIEDFGEGTLSILHGKEGVITEDQLSNLAKGMKETGAVEVADKFAQAKEELRSMDPQKMFAELREWNKQSQGQQEKINPQAIAEEIKNQVPEQIVSEIKDETGAVSNFRRNIETGELYDASGLNEPKEKSSGINPQEFVSSISSSIGASVSSTKPAVDLNSINLPGFGQAIKSNAATVPPSVKPKTAETAKPATKPTEQAASQAESTRTASRGDASLNDVVKSLDSLNKQMSQLLAQTEDLGRRQINATRSNNSNVFDKY